MLNLTFITGAGISHESGLPLFNGTTNKTKNSSLHAFSTEDLSECRKRVLSHYSERLKHVNKTLPSDAHQLIKALEEHYKVSVITQNIDDLHEKAGSADVIHMHGRLTSQRTDANCCHRDCSEQHIDTSKTCPHGSLWRYDVVLYDESIQQYETARRVLAITDILMIVGCSMQTNTAELLQSQVHDLCPIYFINPFPQKIPKRVCLVKQPAYQGIWTALNDFCSRDRS
jgi:NAD-dependent deacetylase